MTPKENISAVNERKRSDTVYDGHQIFGFSHIRIFAVISRIIYQNCRYAVFSKHRRGDVGVRLYYDLSVTGDVYYNEEKFEQDRKLRKLQSTASSSLRKFADQFDKIFSRDNSKANDNE